MNPQHLLTFARMARLRSLTRAAEEMNLGQPAVSGQMKQLQSFVGEPLYERIGHQIRLTPAGEGLLEYAERMERDFREASEYIHRLKRRTTGTLRIGSTMTIASYYLPRHVVRLQAQFPGVHTYITTGDSEEILRRLSDLDLAFIEGSDVPDPLPGKYSILHWREDEIVLIVHRDHEVARLYPEAVPLEVFTRYPVVWREPGSGARRVVENALRDRGIHVPVDIEVMGVAGVKECVRAGLGIGFASIAAMRHDQVELVSRRIAPPEGLRWQLNIIVAEKKMRSRACQAFLDLVLSEGTT